MHVPDKACGTRYSCEGGYGCTWHKQILPPSDTAPPRAFQVLCKLKIWYKIRLLSLEVLLWQEKTKIYKKQQCGKWCEAASKRTTSVLKMEQMTISRCKCPHAWYDIRDSRRIRFHDYMGSLYQCRFEVDTGTCYPDRFLLTSRFIVTGSQSCSTA